MLYPVISCYRSTVYTILCIVLAQNCYATIGAEFHENYDLQGIATPIRVDILEDLLIKSEFDPAKHQFIITGLMNSFDIGYRGPMRRQDTSENIPLCLGTKVDLWNKVMKEVKLGRYAGPFKDIPFDNYMQSPIGLVPKGEDQTRLIFHLSYNFGKDEKKRSFNYHTPHDMCTVKYRDLDFTIRACLRIIEQHPELTIFFSKTDLKSAFRLLPVLIDQIKWLVMMAEDPLTKEKRYFVDKCLPFGTSISCALFQKFSDCLKHLVEFVIKVNTVTNYLDDFLFMAYTLALCNEYMQTFLGICDKIGCPVAMEKTEWGCNLIVFLGVLLDGIRKCLAVPQSKITKVVDQLLRITSKPKKKATIKELQSLTGYLNFLNRAIVPGCASTRRMYSKIPALQSTDVVNVQDRM